MFTQCRSRKTVCHVSGFASLNFHSRPSSSNIAESRPQLLEHVPFTYMAGRRQDGAAARSPLPSEKTALHSRVSMLRVSSSDLGDGKSSVCPISTCQCRPQPFFRIHVIHRATTGQDDHQTVSLSGRPGSQTSRWSQAGFLGRTFHFI
jgi:hypothetical protein